MEALHVACARIACRSAGAKVSSTPEAASLPGRKEIRGPRADREAGEVRVRARDARDYGSIGDEHVPQSVDARPCIHDVARVARSAHATRADAVCVVGHRSPEARSPDRPR